MAEAGINADQCQIGIDHNLGISSVNGVGVPVVYPRSWVDHTCTLHTAAKHHRFWFKGYPGKDQGRRDLLAPFDKRIDSEVIYSNRGRDVELKDQYDWTYFQGLASADYGLCPHMLDWPGDRSRLWTYRYIECLFAKVMPVNFRRTALGAEFVADTHFVWDDEIETDDAARPNTALLDHNFRIAQERFVLTREQTKKILDNSKKVNYTSTTT